MVTAVLLPSAVVDREFVPARSWEELIRLAQSLSQGRCAEKRIVALAEIVVVHIDVKRKQINGYGISEGSLQIFITSFFGFARIGGSNLAKLVSVQRGFAFDFILRLFPNKISKRLRDSSALDKGMANVDKELECDGELVVHQAGGDKNALGVAESQIAVTDRLVTEGDIIAIGDQGVVSLADREWDEVVGLAIERVRNGVGERGNHALEFRCRDGDLSARGIANTIGRLLNGRQAQDFCGSMRSGLGGFGHWNGYCSARGPVAGPSGSVLGHVGRPSLERARECTRAITILTDPFWEGVVSKTPSGFWLVLTAIFRILILTLFFAILGMALGLFVGILTTALYAAIRHTHVDMALAYRMVAIPSAVLFATCAFLFNVINTVRRAVRHA